ncbi:MAG TPA: cytochrome c oxidase assembly protein [Stellaceae bacterium]|nr:cytochrome c oxidase assembly protein [Stellaceae bacterium]
MAEQPRGGPRAGRGTTVVLLTAVVCGMVGLSFASVPLYRLFCAATGFGGTTQRAEAAPGAVGSRIITVRFDAETAPGLGWEFRPLQPVVTVRPGEQKLVFFRAVNRTAEPITGRATFNVVPTKAGIYFDKIQCFCFKQQYLAPGQSADMGVTFFVNPDIVTDPSTADVREITLSYTMFRAHDQERPSAAAAASARSVN